VQGKENIETGKINNAKKNRKTKYYVYTNLKGVYLGFIPPDLTEIVVYWENKTLFE
jgi:hypothetical protein